MKIKMNIFSNKKRGQVTVFVILGIVIIAVVASIFIFRDYFVKNEFEREANKLKLNDEAYSVYNYFRDCIQDAAYEGVKLIASQGGYLEIPNYNYPVNPLVPFSNKLNVFADNGLEVPYWFYETSNGIQKIQRPTIANMENDLSGYIESNIFRCTDNFTLFENYNVRGFEDIDVIANIEDNNVYIKVSSDLSTDYQGVQQDVRNIYVILDTDFGKLYKEASQVFGELYYGNFTEEKTIDMLVLYDELPFSFTEFSCERKVWSKQDVVDDFKKILELNTLKYGNKGNKYFSLDSDIDDDILFSYNSRWPTEIEIIDEGEILKGDDISSNSVAGSFLRSVFCVNDYKFIYNVKYPVLVKLSSDIDFIFAYETLIKSNQAKVNLANSFTQQTSRLCLNKIIPIEVTTNVGDAEVNFKCFDTLCDIGFTDSGGYLRENFPQCLNGLVIAEKEGYKRSESLISTNSEVQVILFLDKIHNFNFDIRVIDNGAVRDLREDEHVVVLFNDEDYSTSITEDSGSVGLAAGNYKVSSIVTKDQKVNIPKQNIKECTSVPKEGLLGLVFKEERCFDIDVGGFDLDSVVVGGNSFELNVDDSDLKNKMVFYVNVYGAPNTQDEILGIFDKIEGGSAVQDFRYPEYE